MQEPNEKAPLNSPSGANAACHPVAVPTMEAKYQALYDESSDAIMYWSVTGDVLAGNRAAVKLFGCASEAELIAIRADGLSPERQPDQAVSTAQMRGLLASVLAGRKCSIEWTFCRADGRQFPAIVWLNRVESTEPAVIVATVRDISAQKEAEWARDESERRLADIIDFLPDATFAIDLDGKVIAWNKAVEEMTGVPAADILGKGDHAYSVPWYGEPRPVLADLVLHPDQATEDRYQSLVRSGDRLIVEVFMPRLGGPAGIHLWATAAPLYDSGGRIVGAIESVRDITVRKKAEELLRASETKYRTLYNAAADAILLRGLDRRIIAANPAAVAMFGCKDEAELLTLKCESLYPPRQPDGSLSAERVDEIAAKAIQSGLDQIEWRYRRVDGTEFDAIVSMQKMRVGDEDVGLLTIRDVTKQKEAERAVRASETKYRTLFDASSDAILLRTTDRRIVAGNPAAVALFGCTSEDELRSLRPMDIYPEYQPDGTLSSEKAPRMAENAMRDGSYSFEWQYKRRDGSEFLANVLWTRMALEGEILLLTTIRDITEQKRAEEALRASEARYKMLYDSATDAIMLRALDRRLIAANPAAVELFGCKDEQQLLSLDPDDLYPRYQPDGLPSVIKIETVVANAIRADQHSIEWRYRRVDGSEFDALVSLQKMRLGDEDVGLVTIRDVTLLKEAERAVRASETKYRTLYNASSDAILLRTPDRGIVAANPAAVALFGYDSEAEMLSLQPTEIYAEHQPDGSVSLEKAPWMAENALREGSYAFEWKYKRRDGSEFLANVLWTRMELAGHILLLTSIRDITKQRLAEEALRASERSYRLLAENIRDVISTVDFSGRITYISPSVVQLLGYAPDEIVHRDLEHVLTPESATVAREYLGQAVAAAMTGRRIRGENRELAMVRKDGTTVETEVAFSGMYDETDTLVAVQGVIRDITERKSAEANLAAARDEAQAANRAKSAFLTTMSHEIRTPMTAILGYTDLLQDAEVSSDKHKSYLAAIRNSGEHLLELINDILDLSKIEAGRLVPKMGRCNLVAMLGGLVNVMRSNAAQRGLAMSLEYRGSMPATIETDEIRLRQAILNLVGNAVKFTERGHVQIVVRFLPEWRPATPGVEIDVTDTGIGIAPEILPQLFKPFSQGDSSVSRKFGGSGLGLAISRQLVEMLGGSLTVTSTLGQGSCFRLIVPTGDLRDVPMLSRPVEADCETAATTPPPDRVDLTGVHILLAEDGVDNLDLISTLLQNAGATVDTAENGRVAVDKVAADPSFDIILMDMNMPEMDGYEATRLLRSRGFTPPIVALTANAMAGDAELCRQAGCDEYLSKPINRSRMLNTIAVQVGLATPLR